MSLIEVIGVMSGMFVGRFLALLNPSESSYLEMVLVDEKRIFRCHLYY
jgi:hypothetical protein